MIAYGNGGGPDNKARLVALVSGMMAHLLEIAPARPSRRGRPGLAINARSWNGHPPPCQEVEASGRPVLSWPPPAAPASATGRLHVRSRLLRPIEQRHRQGAELITTCPLGRRPLDDPQGFRQLLTYRGARAGRHWAQAV
jgi:hypothetical protein